MEGVKQYEVWWASFPQPAGRRPVLLLTPGVLHLTLAVEITSTVRQIAVEVLLGKEEGLPRRCVANCDNIRTVARSALVKRIGQLPPRRHSELKRAVGHALSWDELIDVV